MEIDYTVGDEIVCVETHEDGVVKSGQIFIAKALKIDCCGELNVDVGFNSNIIGKPMLCYNSKHKIINDGIRWLRATRFRSLQKIDISEALEVLEKQPFEI